jgi:hypothetical protein
MENPPAAGIVKIATLPAQPRRNLQKDRSKECDRHHGLPSLLGSAGDDYSRCCERAKNCNGFEDLAAHVRAHQGQERASGRSRPQPIHGPGLPD